MRHLCSALLLAAAAAGEGNVECFGNGDYQESQVPAALDSASYIVAGEGHFCALTGASAVLCWGRNTEGQCNVPSDLGPVAKVQAGLYYSCALTVAGVVRCWGQTLSPPLGSGAATDLKSGWYYIVVKYSAGWTCHGLPDVPCVQPGFSTIATENDLYAVAYATCALTPGNPLTCVAKSGYGVDPPGDLGNVLAFPDDQSGGICVFTSDSGGRCWGEHYGDVPFTNKRGAVAGAFDSRCFISPSGKLDCSMTGRHPERWTAVPARLQDGSNDESFVEQVAIGQKTICVRKRITNVACFGNSDYQETQVPSALGYAAYIVVGESHVCALTGESAVLCWGRNNVGQCDVPSDLGPVAKVQAGQDFSCALTVAGIVRCWGALQDPTGSGAATDLKAGWYYIAAKYSTGWICHSQHSVVPCTQPGFSTMASEDDLYATAHAICTFTPGNPLTCVNTLAGVFAPPGDLGNVLAFPDNQVGGACVFTSDTAGRCFGEHYGDMPFTSKRGAFVGAFNARCFITESGKLDCSTAAPAAERWTAVPASLKDGSSHESFVEQVAIGEKIICVRLNAPTTTTTWSSTSSTSASSTSSSSMTSTISTSTTSSGTATLTSSTTSTSDTSTGTVSSTTSSWTMTLTSSTTSSSDTITGTVSSTTSSGTVTTSTTSSSDTSTGTDSSTSSSETVSSTSSSQTVSSTSSSETLTSSSTSSSHTSTWSVSSTSSSETLTSSTTSNSDTSTWTDSTTTSSETVIVTSTDTTSSETVPVTSTDTTSSETVIVTSAASTSSEIATSNIMSSTESVSTIATTSSQIVSMFSSSISSTSSSVIATSSASDASTATSAAVTATSSVGSTSGQDAPTTATIVAVTATSSVGITSMQSSPVYSTLSALPTATVSTSGAAVATTASTTPAITVASSSTAQTAETSPAADISSTSNVRGYLDGAASTTVSILDETSMTSASAGVSTFEDTTLATLLTTPADTTNDGTSATGTTSKAKEATSQGTTEEATGPATFTTELPAAPAGAAAVPSAPQPRLPQEPAQEGGDQPGFCCPLDEAKDAEKAAALPPALEAARKPQEESEEPALCCPSDPATDPNFAVAGLVQEALVSRVVTASKQLLLQRLASGNLSRAAGQLTGGGALVAARLPPRLREPCAPFSMPEADVSVCVPPTVYDSITVPAGEEVVLVVSSGFGTERLGEVDSSQVEAAAVIELSLLSGKDLNVTELEEPISFKLNASFGKGMVCAFWNETESRWSREGVVTESVTAESISCKTFHLSLFGAIWQGFLRAVECSQFRLLTKERVAEIWDDGWQRRAGAILWWSLLAVGFVLFVVAAIMDHWRQHSQTFCDEFFLIAAGASPVPVRSSDRSDASVPQPKSLLQLASGACTVMCSCMQLSSSAVKDALDEIAGRLWQHFSEARSMIEGIYDGCELECRLDTFASASHSTMTQSIMNTSRKVAGARMGLSTDVIDFVLYDPSVAEILVAWHMQSRGDTVALPAKQDWRYARSQLEAWALLHDEIVQHMEKQLSSHSWCGLPRTAWEIFTIHMPLASFLTNNIFLTCKMKVFFWMLETNGALLFTCVFFAGTGLVRGKAITTQPICEDEDGVGWMVGRVIAIGLGSFLLASLPVSCLEMLRTRGVRVLPYRGCPEWQQQLRAWKAQDALIYLIGSVYLAFGAFFVTLCLANFSPNDHEDFAEASIISLLQECLLLPLVIAVVTPLLAGLLMHFHSSEEKGGKAGILSQVRVRLYASTNAMPPMLTV